MLLDVSCRGFSNRVERCHVTVMITFMTVLPMLIHFAIFPPQVGWQGLLIITLELITEMRSYGTLKERTFLGKLTFTFRAYYGIIMATFSN